MKELLGALEKRMPFILKAICSDNGAEFLNQEVPVDFVNSRAFAFIASRNRGQGGLAMSDKPTRRPTPATSKAAQW